MPGETNNTWRSQAYTRRNSVTLVRNGDEFINVCCDMVRQAQQKILFHTYDFQVDSVTKPFIQDLKARAEQGVQVFILIDAVGSSAITDATQRALKHSNIHFAYFAPLISKKLEHVGRRLHQKLLLVDNHQALVGGINHSAHYIKPDAGLPWLDYAVLLRGEEVFRVQNKVRKLYFKYFSQQRALLDRLIGPHPSPPGSDLQVKANVNDFMRFRSEIYWSYIKAFRQAERRIVIFATYFLPGKRVLRELKKARRRGVEVELIFGAYSDHPTERWSSKYLYNWYLKNGITIYEWDKSVVHSKVALVDENWVTLGSYNHNYLSRYINLELNVEVVDPAFAADIEKEVEQSKKHCRVVSCETWERETRVWQSCLYFCTYMLANLITLVSTVFVIRHKDREFNR